MLVKKLVVYVRKDLLRLIKFIFIGAIATLVHLAAAIFFLYIFKNLSLFVINFIAFVIAFAFSYIGHRYVTFSKSGSIVKFFFTSMAGFVLNSFVILVGQYAQLNDKLCLVIAITIVPVFTYILANLWVFKLIKE